MCVLAVDLGASFIKCARVWPAEGVVEPAVRRPFPPFCRVASAKAREVRVDDILAVTRSVMEDSLRNGPHPSGIFLCGQMHGLVLVTSDGERLSEFISWQDSRSLEALPDSSESCFTALRRRLGPEILAELGNELRPGSPLATLFTMKLRGELPAGAIPLSLPDYVALALCGRLRNPATDPTNAAAHGGLAVATRTWHHEALRRSDLHRLVWPEILPAATPLGDFSHDGRSIVVHLPIGDQQAALFGAELAEGELSINVATGSQVSTVVSRPDFGDWQLRPYLGNRWLRTITHLPAGRALNALIGLLNELAEDQGTPLLDPWQSIERLVSQSPRPTLQANVSFFPCAVGDEGSLVHMTENDLHVGPLFRAAFRSMADNYSNAAKRIAPHGWSRAVFSGGLIRQSAGLQAEIVSLLGTPVRVVAHTEDTLAGLMHLARGIA
jgi:sugar (pentulose or hexulose) kinase